MRLHINNEAPANRKMRHLPMLSDWLVPHAPVDCYYQNSVRLFFFMMPLRTVPSSMLPMKRVMTRIFLP